LIKNIIIWHIAKERREKEESGIERWVREELAQRPAQEKWASSLPS
jgi:hypothetical protein